jgi:hypothetical protein
VQHDRSSTWAPKLYMAIAVGTGQQVERASPPEAVDTTLIG